MTVSPVSGYLIDAMRDRLRVAGGNSRITAGVEPQILLARSADGIRQPCYREQSP